ncbi:MAG: phage integrase family protein [Lachnospiraceae bacterium]|nr:phage integrase family protein [Lachnospiraceae bacterium]
MGSRTRFFISEYLRLCPFPLDELPFLFVSASGFHLSRNAVKLMIRKTASSLPFDLSSHKLRHNFATNYCVDQMEQSGRVDIYRLMYIMGHEDIKTTNRYLHFACEILAGKGHISHLDLLDIL